MRFSNKIKVSVEGIIWFGIGDPKMSVREAVRRLRKVGNPIIEVDEKNRQIKCLHTNAKLKDRIRNMFLILKNYVIYG